MMGGQTLEQGITETAVSPSLESLNMTGQGPEQPYLVGLTLSRELDLTTSRSSFQTKLFHDCVRTLLIQPSKPEPEFVPCLGEP